MTQITYPSNRVVVQSVDAIGRLCAVGASGSTCSTGTTYATGYGYNAAQQLTGFNYGNGVAATFGYSNDRLQLTSLNYQKGSTLFGLTYSYGAAGSNNGQIQSITDSVDNGRTVTYTYDTLSRLSTAVTTGSAGYPAWGLQQAYDRYGNRLSQTAISGCVGLTCPQPSVSVDVTTNRIIGSPYAYDANGNMTNDASNTLVYDAENRLLSATNGGTSGAYSYDGNGLRVKKCVPNCTSPTTTTVYLFSGTKVIAEYNNGAAADSPSREYIYSAGALLAKIDSTGTTYYHQDHLSNRLVTDSSGNTAAQLGHFPFGESWYNASNDKLLFTSYERDAESGNDYAMARFDINGLGRFSSPDPLAGSVANPQSLNRYPYSLNDPLNFEDPFGLEVITVGACRWDHIVSYIDTGSGPQHAGEDWVFLDCSGGGGGGQNPIPPDIGSGGGGSNSGFGIPNTQKFNSCMQQFYNSSTGKVVETASVLSTIPGFNPNWKRNLVEFLFAGLVKKPTLSGLSQGRDYPSIITGAANTEYTFLNKAFGTANKVGEKAAPFVLLAGATADLTAHATCYNIASGYDPGSLMLTTP